MKPLRGLYAITPESLVRGERTPLLAAVAAAIRGGARLIQYRDKWRSGKQRVALARALLTVCHDGGAQLIINDDVELALASGADGVHLGRGDGSLAAARARLGSGALIGASCQDSLPRAMEALAAGADHVAFGRFFTSTTKPEAPPAHVSTLHAARLALRAPICAIGGITPATAPLVIAAGADLVAAVDGVFGAADVEAAARAYTRAFTDAGLRKV